MNRKAAAIADRIAAVEQRLLVAVLRRDDHARLLARGEIALLKEQLRPAAQRIAGDPAPESAPLLACGDQR